MTFTDEELMAYADGELDDARRQQIQEAIGRDPEIAHRVNAHRTLRDSLRASFDPMLEEPVPVRLVATARSGAHAAQIDAGSGASAAQPDAASRAGEPLPNAQPHPPAQPDAGSGSPEPQPGTLPNPREAQPDAGSRSPELQPGTRFEPRESQHDSRSNVVPLRGHRVPVRARPKWIALAASFILGALALQVAQHFLHAPIYTARGEILTSAELQQALSNQLASTASAQSGFKAGVSFLSKTGQYCRTFTLQSLAGLACNDAGDWKVQVLAHTSAPGTAYRQAGSNMPPAIVQAVTDTIAGAPLDAREEANARAQKWQHPK